MILGRRDQMVVRRAPVARPDDRAAPTFACPACDVVLWDGVVYQYCPTCELPVDWVDLSLPLWCCPGCDAVVNQARDSTPQCATCQRAMESVGALERPPVELAPPPRGRARRALGVIAYWGAGALLVTAFVLVPLFRVLDPKTRMQTLAMLLPLLLIPLGFAISVMVGLPALLRELRDLMRDRATRVVHGLEHAAAHLLTAEGFEVQNGLTYSGSHFELFARNDGREREQAAAMRRALKTAIARIRGGDRGLAYHPQCGTSLVVSVVLVALLVIAVHVVGIVMHARPLVVLGSLAASVLVVALTARRLGLLAQRLLTVLTAFRSVSVVRVARTLTGQGDQVCWDVYLRVRLKPPG